MREGNITRWIIIVSILAFILEYFFYKEFVYLLGFNPYLIETKFYIWQFITYPFVFSVDGSSWGIFRFLIDMYVLWLFGTSVESAYGGKRFLAFILLNIIGGSLIMFLFYILGIPYTLFEGVLRSQDMIFLGIFFAFTLLYPDELIYLFFILPIKTKYLAIVSLVFLILPLVKIVYIFGIVYGLLYIVYAASFFTGLFVFWLIDRKNRIKYSIKKRIVETEDIASQFFNQAKNLYLLDKGNRIILKLKEGEELSSQDERLIEEIREKFYSKEANLCPPYDFSLDDPTCRKCEWLANCILREIDTLRKKGG